MTRPTWSTVTWSGAIGFFAGAIVVAIFLQRPGAAPARTGQIRRSALGASGWQTLHGS